MEGRANGAARCYTWLVPTTRPRHTVTETPPVQAALDELRTRLGHEASIDFAELVILGAQAKARRLRTDDAASRAAAKRLADMVRAGSMPFDLDVDAADEVKRLGLIDRHE